MSDSDKKPKKKPGPKPPPPLVIDTDRPLDAFDRLLGAGPERVKSVARGRACLASGCTCKGYIEAKSPQMPSYYANECDCGHFREQHILPED